MKTTCSSCGQEFETKTDCHQHSCEIFDSENHEYRDIPRACYTVDGAGPADSFEVLGKFTQPSVNQCWQHEAGEFIPWLVENPIPIEECLDTCLHNIKTEVSAGRYRADIVAENTDGDRLVIETHLETSDHDHLGKLLTYGTYFGADELIWVAKSFTKGHIRTALELTKRYDDTTLSLVTFDVNWVGEYRPVVTFDTIWE